MAAESDFMTCKNNSLLSYFTELGEMKKRGEFCDVTFRVGDQSLSAHRNIIAAALPYFRTLLRTNSQDSAENVLHNIDASTLDTFINFAYGKQIIVNEENVQSLLLGAEFLQVQQVYEVCLGFLEQRLRPDNVFLTRTFGQSSKKSGIVDMCDRYILKNLAECSQREEFLDLPLTYMKDLIKRDDLKVENEEKVFEMLMKWVKKSPSQRQEALSMLLKDVRLTLLSPLYLIQKVATEELVRKLPACKDLVEEAKSFHLLPETLTSFSSFRISPRCYMDDERTAAANKEVDGVYVVSLVKSDPVVECYDFERRSWETLRFEKVCDCRPTTDRKPNYTNSSATQLLNLVVHSGKIYAFVNGYLHVLNLETKSWEIREGVAVPSSAVVIHCNNIYFCKNDRNGNFCMTLFDPMTYSLTEVTCTSLGRSDPGLVSFNESICVLGGIVNSKSTKNVFAYNIHTKIWTILPSMREERYRPCAAANKETIWVCGGSYNAQNLITAEVYSSMTNQWISIAPLVTCGEVLSSIFYRGKLQVVQSSYCLLTLSIYNPKKGTFDPKKGTFESHDVFTKNTGIPEPRIFAVSKG